MGRPSLPTLPREQQREFEDLQRAAQMPLSSPSSSPAEADLADARKPFTPDLEGDTNPPTGEQGGPKKEPVGKWVEGDDGDWSFKASRVESLHNVSEMSKLVAFENSKIPHSNLRSACTIRQTGNWSLSTDLKTRAMELLNDGWTDRLQRVLGVSVSLQSCGEGQGQSLQRASRTPKIPDPAVTEDLLALIGEFK